MYYFLNINAASCMFSCSSFIVHLNIVFNILTLVHSNHSNIVTLSASDELIGEVVSINNSFLTFGKRSASVIFIASTEPRWILDNAGAFGIYMRSFYTSFCLLLWYYSSKDWIILWHPNKNQHFHLSFQIYSIDIILLLLHLRHIYQVIKRKYLCDFNPLIDHEVVIWYHPETVSLKTFYNKSLGYHFLYWILNQLQSFASRWTDGRTTDSVIVIAKLYHNLNSWLCLRVNAADQTLRNQSSCMIHKYLDSNFTLLLPATSRSPNS